MARSRRFKSSEEFEIMPEDSAYTHVCKVCWPLPTGDGGSMEESSASSSAEETGDEIFSE